jgi:hypothetical protein
MCGLMLALKKFQILEHFRDEIFRLGILNLYFQDTQNEGQIRTKTTMRLQSVRVNHQMFTELF